MKQLHFIVHHPEMTAKGINVFHYGLTGRCHG